MTPHATRLAGLIAGQTVAQILGAASGLLLAWKLPRQDYAWLTIINSMTAAVLTLCDPATGTGLQSIGGRVCADRQALSSLVSTALRLRWSLCVVTFTLAGSWTMALLLLNGATRTEAAILCGIGAAGLPAALGYSIHSVVCKLQGRLRLLLASDVWTAVCRLAGTAAFVLIGPVAALAVLAVTLSQFTQYWLGAKQTAPLLSMPAVESVEHRSELVRQVRQMFLYSLFLCAEAQLGVWLLGLFGNEGAVADLGALMRLGVILAFMGPVFQYWIIPGFARFTDMALMRKRLLQAAAGTLGALAAIGLLASLASDSLLFFLGPNYRHLGPEIPWVMLFFSVNILNSAAWWINTARGWTQLSWLVPPVTTVLMVCLVLWMRPADTHAALIFRTLSFLPGLIIAATQMALAIRERRR